MMRALYTAATGMRAQQTDSGTDRSWYKSSVHDFDLYAGCNACQ